MTETTNCDDYGELERATTAVLNHPAGNCDDCGELHAPWDALQDRGHIVLVTVHDLVLLLAVRDAMQAVHTRILTLDGGS